MTPKKRRRLAFAIALVVAGAGVAAIVIVELGKNTQYFFSPSDVSAQRVAPGTAFRIGGLVAQQSVRRGPGADVQFTLTDGNHAVPVDYHGVLPGLFREGQGVVALGALDGRGVFEASEVLAKHDERYMPPEVVDALKRSGRWKGGAQ